MIPLSDFAEGLLVYYHPGVSSQEPAPADWFDTIKRVVKLQLKAIQFERSAQISSNFVTAFKSYKCIIIKSVFIKEIMQKMQLKLCRISKFITSYFMKI